MFLTLMSEHSVLELVGAPAILTVDAWLSVAKKLLVPPFTDNGADRKKTSLDSFYSKQWPQKVCAWGEVEWIHQPGVLLRLALALVVLQFVFITTHASSIKICHMQLNDIESNINAQDARAFL